MKRKASTSKQPASKSKKQKGSGPLKVGLPPIVAAPGQQPLPHTLILGSGPSEESLRQQRYYAFKHNHFFPIMGELLDFDAKASYEVRVAALTARGFAVWDVLASFKRTGSADSTITDASVND